MAPERSEDSGKQVVGARILVGEGKLDRGLDIALDLDPDGLDTLVVELSALSQQPLEPRERILGLPLRDERGVAHVRKVRAHRVLHPPERLQLEKGRPGALPGPREGARDRVLDASRSFPSPISPGIP